MTLDEEAWGSLRDNPRFKAVLQMMGDAVRQTIADLSACEPEHRDGFAKQLAFQMDQFEDFSGSPFGG